MGQSALSNAPSFDRPLEEGAESGYESLVRQTDEGLNEIILSVDGVHCALCIQKIESRLANEEGIVQARLNFSTRRLIIQWKGAASRANDFAQSVSALGYGVHPYDPRNVLEGTKEEERFLLLCLGVAGFAMGNIMLFSVGLWATTIETMGLATRDLMHWITGAIAIPTVIFSGRPFFRSALKALFAGHTNMDVPISLAIVLACGMSLLETFNHGEHVYFDSAVMLMFFLLIGRYLDFRARRSARSTATDLLSTLSGFASVLEKDGKTRRVPIADLREGMKVRVAAGEKFPADGFLLEGETEVDTSLVTGETLPRMATKDTEIFAGTLNLSAPVTICVAKAAEDSLLSDIVRLMEKAGQGQAEYVRLADKAAQLYTPIVHILSAATFLGWWLGVGADWQEALMVAITVLIITCPCALGLAVPVVQVLATGRLMKEGILVKAGDALERLAKIDTILLDKTGTLTLGQPALQNKEDIPPQVFRLAAALAVQSTHPLSGAVSNAYDGALPDIKEVQEHPGKGLEGRFESRTIKLGSRKWCGDMDAPPSEVLELWLRVENEAPVRLTFEDELRRDAKDVISALKAQNITPYLLSGDRQSVAARVAQEVGIETYWGEKIPSEKYEILEGLKKEGHHILMVGDGLNDAPALAGADISISPSTAIDMAQNAADIVFMGERLSPLVQAHRVAVQTQKLVKQNFALAVSYNIIAVPLAMAGLVTPFIAALAMSGSSLIVIANSFRLKWSR